MNARPLSMVLLLLLVGCGTIEQKVQPVSLSGTDAREICVIENPDVGHDFLPVYKAALSEKHLTVRMLPANSPPLGCPLTSTYVANWRWDLALYMAYADMKVYRNGLLVGEATYDAMREGSPAKFITAKTKIQELTTLLFPG